MTPALSDDLLARGPSLVKAHAELAALLCEGDQLRQAFDDAVSEARSLHDEWQSAVEPIARLRDVQAQLAENERATLAVIKALLRGAYGHLA